VSGIAPGSFGPDQVAEESANEVSESGGLELRQTCAGKDGVVAFVERVDPGGIREVPRAVGGEAGRGRGRRHFSPRVHSLQPRPCCQKEVVVIPDRGLSEIK